MVYDADLKVAVLFGGEGANGPLADTWTFNGAAWSKVGGNCPSSAPVPARLPLPQGHPSPSITPAQDVWVNDPQGVNLRSRPDPAATRVAVLPQGATAHVLAMQAGANGSTWYQVTFGSQQGWLDGAYVVGHPITTYRSPDGWSLMVPAGYEVRSPQISSGLPHTEIVPSAQAGRSDRLPLLVVWTGGPGDSAPSDVQLAPPAMRTDVDWQNEDSFNPAVGGVTVAATVSRAPIDLCVLPGAAAGPAAGWPFLLTFTAKTAAHTYFFMLVSDTPEAALVQQVMQSVSLK